MSARGIPVRKKPVVVLAIEWTGKNQHEIHEFMESPAGVTYEIDPADNQVYIDTLEGTMRADIGDWIIRGTKGEYYPIKPEIFHEVYEFVDSERNHS